MEKSIVRVGLESRLYAVEGKGRDGGENAGGARRDFGSVPFYPPPLLLVAGVVSTELRRHGPGPKLFAGDILEFDFNWHGSLRGRRSSLEGPLRIAGFLAGMVVELSSSTLRSILRELQTVASSRGPESSARSRYCNGDGPQELCHQEVVVLWSGGE